MKKSKKKLVTVELPEFQASIDSMPDEDRIFVERSLEISEYLYHVMTLKKIKQKDLAELMKKSEAEISKILSGMQNLTMRTLAKLEAALGTPVVCTPEKVLQYLQEKGADGEMKDSVYRVIKHGDIPVLEYTENKKVKEEAKVISMSAKEKVKVVGYTDAKAMAGSYCEIKVVAG